jgi:hypothetical protein
MVAAWKPGGIQSPGDDPADEAHFGYRRDGGRRDGTGGYRASGHGPGGSRRPAAKPAPLPRATLRVVPGWTYQGSGKLAVIASCSQRGDLRVIGSKLLPRPVTLRKGPNLLIKITNKTRPGKYAINLFCTGKNKQIDSAATKKVRILKVLGAFWQPDAPGLPKHFKPDVTVSSGPPPPAKKGHGAQPAKPRHGR